MKRKQAIIITSIFILCLSVFSGCCFRAKLPFNGKFESLKSIEDELDRLDEISTTDTRCITEEVVENTGMLMELEKAEPEASESLDDLLEFILK